MGLAVVEEIEDRGNELVHALDVVYLWVETAEDEQDARHVIVPVHFVVQIEVGRLRSPTDELAFLFAGVGEEREREGRCGGGEERELGLCSAGVLFDLFPKLEVIFVVFPGRICFVWNEWSLCILVFAEVLFDELLVDKVVRMYLFSPFFSVFRQVVQRYLPDVLANVFGLFRNAPGK